jgi:hypothetical protein
MARGMRKFIALQVERAAEDGTPCDASLAYIKDPTPEQKPRRSPRGRRWTTTMPTFTPITGNVSVG